MSARSLPNMRGGFIPLRVGCNSNANAMDAWVAVLWGSLGVLALVAAVLPDDTGTDVIRVGAIVAALATMVFTARALRYRVISPWLAASGLVIGGGSVVAVALRLGDPAQGPRGGDGIILLISATCALLWLKQDVEPRIQVKRADRKIADAGPPASGDLDPAQPLPTGQLGSPGPRTRTEGSMARAGRLRTGSVAALLLAAGCGIVLLEPWHGPIVLSLSTGHGIDTGDLPALPLLALAVAIAFGRTRRGRAAPQGRRPLASGPASAVLLGVLLMLAGMALDYEDGGPLVPAGGGTFDGSTQHATAHRADPVRPLVARGADL